MLVQKQLEELFLEAKRIDPVVSKYDAKKFIGKRLPLNEISISIACTQVFNLYKDSLWVES